MKTAPANDPWLPLPYSLTVSVRETASGRQLFREVAGVYRTGPEAVAALDAVHAAAADAAGFARLNHRSVLYRVAGLTVRALVSPVYP